MNTRVDWESPSMKGAWVVAKILATGFVSIMLFVCQSYLSNISTKVDAQAATQVLQDKNQALDHAQLQNVQREADATVVTLQSLSDALKSNTDQIKYLSAQQAKDDAFRESRGAQVKEWQR
jgi:Zn-dependent oligopeptidase